MKVEDLINRNSTVKRQTKTELVCKSYGRSLETTLLYTSYKYKGELLIFSSHHKPFFLSLTSL